MLARLFGNSWADTDFIFRRLRNLENGTELNKWGTISAHGRRMIWLSIGGA